MKFLINREKILGPLERVNTAVDRSPKIPLLSHICIKAEDGNMTFIGSSIDVEVVETISDVDVADFALTIPARNTLTYCKLLPENSELLFELQDSQLLISVQSEDARPDSNYFRVDVLDADDFPSMLPPAGSDASEGWTTDFQVNRSEFQELLNRTSFAMAKSDSRPYLVAMMLEITPDGLRSVATDAHRLATSEVGVLTEVSGESRIIVPNKMIEHLTRLLPELVSNITVQANTSHVRVSTPQLMITSTVQVGQYPDWRSAIPTNLTHSFEVDRKRLESVFSRVNILESDTGIVTTSISVENGQLRVNAKTQTQEINEALEVTSGDEPFSFQVNSQYVVDVIRAMSSSESLKFNYRNVQTPCMIKNPSDESSTYLIMLMKD